jgi:hypothetical protein
MKTVLLGIFAVGSFAAAVYFYSVSSSLEADLAKAKSDNASEGQKSEISPPQSKKAGILLKQKEKEVARLEEEVDKLSNRISEQAKQNKEEIKKIIAASEAGEEIPQPDQVTEKKTSSFLKSYLKNEIDKNYSKLFSSLNLPPEELDAIKKMLLNRDLEITDTIFKSMANNLELNEGESMEQGVARHLLESIENTESMLKDQLGDNFPDVREEEKMIYVWKDISELNKSLGEENQFDGEQKKEIAEILRTHNDTVLQEVAEGGLTFEQADERLVKQSSEHLNEKQINTFRTYLKRKRGK